MSYLPNGAHKVPLQSQLMKLQLCSSCACTGRRRRKHPARLATRLPTLRQSPPPAQKPPRTA
jgi:hypothetical protein